MNQCQKIIGVVLAGGATRMGGKDKGLQLLNNTPLWQHVADTLADQVSSMTISANRHVDIYQRSGYPVYQDNLMDYPVRWRECFLLCSSRTESGFSFVHVIRPSSRPVWLNVWCSGAVVLPSSGYDGERDHPTIALINRSLISALEDYGRRRATRHGIYAPVRRAFR